MSSALQRTAFVTSRALEFFSTSELATQFGYGPKLWPILLAKELIDNALDSAEPMDAAPVISITLEQDALIIGDNGPGILAEVIEKSLNYEVRISDKKHYISPTRGQLGNALKCVWAAPFVATGNDAHAEVISLGMRHDIAVSVDRIAQQPKINLSTEKLPTVKKGTSIRIEWNGIASFEMEDENADFYQGTFKQALGNLVCTFAIFNPHVQFCVQLLGEKPFTLKPSDQSWMKWRACDPTSAHWYRPEDLRGLIAAYISSGAEKTLRNFVREFNGLSGTQYCRDVLKKADLQDCSLSDLVSEGDVDMGRVERLLAAMKEFSREVLPKRLGIIGKGHFALYALKLGLTPHTMGYKKIEGFFDGSVPFVVEVAFGLKTEGEEDLFIGLNNSPVLKVPTHDLSRAESDALVSWSDPVVFIVHLCSPRFEFTDHGKGNIVDKVEVSAAIRAAIESATKHFTKAKRKALRADRNRLTPEEIEQERVKEDKKKEKNVIKDAAYACMAEAYLKASDDGRLPANARQVMYAARPLVLKATGGRCWKNSATFTQTLLPDYQRDYPDQTSGWNIAYDARGHFREPHTGVEFGIGTLEVREYLGAWRSGTASTYGPQNRFSYALFIEKEGFDPLIKESGIEERFDLSFLSTKGMSVTACRELVEELSGAGVTTLVAHDFDFSGFGIVHTLGHDTRRYEFDTAPKVIDLGLRLADVRDMKLDAEPVIVEQDKDPRIKLREYGARSDEIEFLVTSKHGSGKGAYWSCQRVELNAMTSRQFIEWLEQKLIEHGVAKVIPEMELLAEVWQSAHRTHAYKRFAAKRLQEIQDDFDRQYKEPKTPKDLQGRLASHFEKDPAASWNDAISSIALADTQGSKRRRR